MDKSTFAWVPFSLAVLLLITGYGCDVAAAGLGLSLDGVNDRAQAVGTVFPNSSALQSFTIEGWMFPRNAGRFIATDDAYDFILFSQPGAANGGVGIRFTLWDGTGGSQSKTEFRDIRLNEWNHVAVMFDATTLEMVIGINGILSSAPSTFSESSFYADSDQQFVLGAFNSTSGGFFNGFLDEVRVSDIVRYTGDFAPPDSLNMDANTRALFHFNETVGSTTFVDASGNGNTLTGINGAVTATIDRMEQVPGDFNGDGTVDAADYVMWRNDDGLQTAYDIWQANFGRTSGSRASAVSSAISPIAVPEPSSFLPMLSSLLVMRCSRQFLSGRTARAGLIDKRCGSEPPDRVRFC
jgi:hypothetical protein